MRLTPSPSSADIAWPSEVMMRSPFPTRSRQVATGMRCTDRGLRSSFAPAAATESGLSPEPAISRPVVVATVIARTPSFWRAASSRKVSASTGLLLRRVRRSIMLRKWSPQRAAAANKARVESREALIAMSADLNPYAPPKSDLQAPGPAASKPQLAAWVEGKNLAVARHDASARAQRRAQNKGCVIDVRFA